jgi:hypothetical protein
MTELTLHSMPRTDGLDASALSASFSRAGANLEEHAASAVTHMLEQTDWTRPGVMAAADTLTWWLRTDHPGLSKDMVLEAIAAGAGMGNWDRLSAMLPVRHALPDPLEGYGEMTQHLSLTRGQRAALLEGLAAVASLHRADYGRLIAVYGSPDQPKPVGDSAAAPRLPPGQRHANLAEVAQYLAMLGVAVRGVLNGQPRESHALDHLERVHARLERTRASSRASVVLPMTVAERDVVIEAADHYTRILMGQPYGVTDTLRFGRVPDHDVFHSVEAIMDRVHRMLTGMPANASAGIGNPGVSDTARVLYDIHQVLRFQAAEERGMDRWTTWRSTPMQFSVHEKLPMLSVREPGPGLRAP